MSIKITILVEGDTEKAFFPALRKFLKDRLAPDTMPKLDPLPYHGRLPTGDKLKRVVTNLLSEKRPSDAVIALSDVYTGTREFADARDAKAKMREWVGKELRFHPHVAHHDFEAWLLPFWKDIQILAGGSNRTCPNALPEHVNHGKPPAYHLQEIFRTGSKGKRYIKPRDADRILRDNDLLVAAKACPELKEFLNTILSLCGAPKL